MISSTPSNIGTTATGLLASASMGGLARSVAWINTGFKLIGAAIFAPVLVAFAQAVVQFAPSADAAVAWAHLVFNFCSAALLLLALPWYSPRLERWALARDAERTGPS